MFLHIYARYWFTHDAAHFFLEWSCESSGSETDFANVDAEELNSKLKKFYLEASPKDVGRRQKNMPEQQASEYHKNTLKNVRAAINRHLKDIGSTFDIVRDKEFRTANNCLDGKLKHNVRQGVSRPTQHKDVISHSDLGQVTQYLNSTQSPVILRYKVWYDLCVHFVTRGLEFHQQLTLQSFEFMKDENDIEYVVLSHETKQKNRQGGLLNEEAPSDKRMYATENESCPVKSLKLLIEKTPPESTSLINHCTKEALASPDSEQYWYLNKPVRPYQYSKFMKDICRNANCSKPYTAHCLRATAIQAMNDAGFELRHIMFMSGHKNESSVRSYNRNCSDEQKKQISNALATITNKPDELPNDAGFELPHIMFMSGHKTESSVRSYNRNCSAEQKKQISNALATITNKPDELPNVETPVLTPPLSTDTKALPGPSTTSNDQSIQSHIPNLSSNSFTSSGFISNSSFQNCVFQFHNENSGNALSLKDKEDE